MGKYKNNLIVFPLVMALTLALILPMSAYAAATAPPLGEAASFSALAAISMSAAAPGTTVSGDIGLSTGTASSRTGNWIVGGSQYFGPLSLAASAHTDALGAFNDLAGQSSDGAWNGDTSPAPGVWTEAGNPSFTGTLTLNGNYSDVWVFKISTDFTFSGSVNLTGGAQPCNVFWQIDRDATIASDSQFQGTLIAGRDVTLVSGATVNGRIIALDGSLVTDDNDITGPDCISPATLHVIKHVINNNGGSAVASAFTLNVTGTNVSDATFAGAEDPGTTITLDPGSYSVDESVSAGYGKSLSVGCSGTIGSGETVTCIVTNDDIAEATDDVADDQNADPTDDQIADVAGAQIISTTEDDTDSNDHVEIKVRKTASPASLPAGPGSVTYTYKVTNVGDHALKRVSVEDDKCGDVRFVSGDSDHDSRLDKGEKWMYSCSKEVAKTETNKATARGTAIGQKVKDTDKVTVVVSSPRLPNAGAGPVAGYRGLLDGYIARLSQLTGVF